VRNRACDTRQSHEQCKEKGRTIKSGLSLYWEAGTRTPIAISGGVSSCHPTLTIMFVELVRAR